jgi:hypothetical protein
MVGGFNHNFRHKGELYHVQTEDGGRKNPRIVTQLFHGGTVLASQKQAYDDILGLADLSQQVESRMQEQHKEMLRRLRSGDFDETIDSLVKGAPQQEASSLEPAADDGLEVLEIFEKDQLAPVVEENIDLDELVFIYLAGNDNRY